MPFRQARPFEILIAYCLRLILKHFQEELSLERRLIITLRLITWPRHTSFTGGPKIGPRVHSTIFLLISAGGSRSQGAQTAYLSPIPGSLTQPSSGLLTRGSG
jgi:hypothetical protein